MTEDTSTSTVQPTGTSSFGHVDPSSDETDISAFWLVWIPLLVISIALVAWGLSLILVGQAPDFLPRLPGAFGGMDLVGVATVLALAPYGIHEAIVDRNNRLLEDQFPDFLTDLAANRRAGFTLSEAVRVAADSDYGPLTEHVDRMASQLSWNIPFEEALERFSNRVDTPLVTRSVTLVLEAERTGGYITDVLEAVARDAREIKRLDRERRLAMRTYTIVMYVTFAVFLLVVAVLQAQLLPQLLEATQAAQGAAGAAPGPFQGIAAATTLEDHRTFFYTAALVQAVGTGSMAGMMARGKVGPGMLHGAIMAAISVLTFSVWLA